MPGQLLAAGVACCKPLQAMCHTVCAAHGLTTEAPLATQACSVPCCSVLAGKLCGYPTSCLETRAAIFGLLQCIQFDQVCTLR